MVVLPVDNFFAFPFGGRLFSFYHTLFATLLQGVVKISLQLSLPKYGIIDRIL
jgi:hypothetical protein